MSAGIVGAFSRKRSDEPGTERQERRGRFLLRSDMKKILLEYGTLVPSLLGNIYQIMNHVTPSLRRKNVKKDGDSIILHPHQKNV